jgi:hypothetical protein
MSTEHLGTRRQFLVKRTLDRTTNEYVEESQSVLVTLEIDLDAVFSDLGKKAFKNKSRRAEEMGGRIVARVIPD